jgi:hypothetical protein
MKVQRLSIENPRNREVNSSQSLFKAGRCSIYVIGQKGMI